MNRTDKNDEKKSSVGRKFLYTIGISFILIIIFGGYIFSENYFANETATSNKELGDKVIITLPNGKKVYTYENLIVEEDGKLLYKGDRSTIDLTGGVVVYEDWES